MMCPPHSVNTYGTPSRRKARATTRPPCIAISVPHRSTRSLSGKSAAPAQPAAARRTQSAPQQFSRSPSRPETSVSARLAKFDVLDVGNLLTEILGEAFLDPHLDLAHALARDAELVADLLERDRFFIAHERLEAPFVDHQILALQRLPELARGPTNEVMIFLVGDGVGSLRGPWQKIKERRLLALVDRRVD